MTRTSAFLTGLAAAYLIVMAILFLLLVAFPPPAKAFDDFHWGNAPPEHRKAVRKRHKSTRVKVWSKKDEPWPDHSKPSIFKDGCKHPVAVVGSQRVSESEAEESAQKAWMEEVRFSHGEVYMSIDKADAYAKLCSRSSIGEVMNQTMHRCRVIAVPCRPDLQEGGATK